MKLKILLRTELVKQIMAVGLIIAVTPVFSSHCPTPKPFQLLEDEAANQYIFEDILRDLPQQAHTKGNKENLIRKPHVPTAINFWATWCAPCRDELPLLNLINKQQLANIWLVNVGDNAETVKALLDELNVLHLPSFLAESELLSQLSLVGLPATIVWNQSSVYLGMGKLDNQAALEQWFACLSKIE